MTLLDRLQCDVDALTAIALSDRLDRELAVPGCPGWTVADMFGHLWSIEDWVRRVLRTRTPCDATEPNTDPERAVADFVAAVPDFLTAMRAIVPDEPCWNFGPRPRTAGFWIRRQAHEHAIHHWDVADATRLDAVSFDTDLAIDGIGEVITMFAPRQIRLGRATPLHASVGLHATDAAVEWRIGDDGEVAATLSAPAHTLYLGVWKRVSLLDDPGVRVDGDRTALRDALAHLTP